MKVSILLIASILLLSSSMKVPDQASTLEVYSTVPSISKLDVSLYLNGQSIYPAPLEKGKKLLHTVHSTGKFTLLAKVTNSPGYRSKSLELEFTPGKRNVIILGAIKTDENAGNVLLTDVTDKAKQVAKLDSKQDEWTLVESQEDVANPYAK